MSLTPEFWLKFLMLIVAMAGGGFALYRWDHTVKIKRAALISQIIEKIRFNEEISGIVNMIDYTCGWYNDDFHENKSEIELKIDRLFSYMDYIFYLRKKSIISDDEFECLQYKLNRICSLHDTQAYLWNIHHFSQDCNSLCSFPEMVKYAYEKKFLHEDFFKKTCTNYVKRLPF